MAQAKLIAALLAGAVLLSACSGRAPRMEWKRVAMDGSRTGVVPVNAENVDSALGTFEGACYVAPDGKRFTGGTTPEVARLLIEAQPRMARLKQVVGHSAELMQNLRDEPDLPLGNLVADVLREKGSAYFGVPMDFAIVNYGGIRVPMPEGAVTLDDIESMFPFKNYMCYAKVRGKNLLRLLEQLAKTPAFQAVSGVRVRVKDHQLVEAEIGGQPIDPERLYHVVTIDFLLSGGDQIAIGALAEDVILSPVLLQTVMLDYIRDKEAAGQVIDAHSDGRVVMED